MSYLKIVDLDKSFGNHKILHAINLDIVKGDFLTFLGPSGCGKTTLLRCIAGLERPDVRYGDSPDARYGARQAGHRDAVAGSIHLNGKALSSRDLFVPPEKRNIGMVFQNYAVWPHMNVMENVFFPLKIRGTKDYKKARDAISLVKLSGLENRFPHELSGGQQQRVALARSLAMSPDLLLLDEPLSNLDALLREELASEIRRLQQTLGLTTILVTHDQKEALSLSDRIVVLHQGKIEAQGSPEDLYSNPPTDFVAQFISGAQTLVTRSGAKALFLPRRWKLTPGTHASANAHSLKIVSRIYLGKEYEYWADAEEFSEPVRFFLETRLEIGATARMVYN